MWDGDSNHRGFPFARRSQTSPFSSSMSHQHRLQNKVILKGLNSIMNLKPLQISSPTPMRGSVNFCAFKNTNFLHGPMQHKVESGQRQAEWLFTP